jgi:hypothetical protein
MSLNPQNLHLKLQLVAATGVWGARVTWPGSESEALNPNCSLSLHLVSWGKGRIVQCVNKNSVYLVSPFAEFHKVNKMTQAQNLSVYLVSPFAGFHEVEPRY